MDKPNFGVERIVIGDKEVTPEYVYWADGGDDQPYIEFKELDMNAEDYE